MATPWVGGRTLAGRTGMLQILEALGRGDVACVVVRDVSRLSRDEFTADIGLIARQCALTGARIVTPEKVYDPRDPSDRLLLGLQGLLAEWDRSWPVSAEHPEDETFPGLLILRPEGRMFFANAENLAEKMRPLVEAARPRVVALDLSAVFDLEYTALKMLTEAEKRQREHGVLLWLVGLNPDVLAVVRRSPLGGVLGRER